MQETEYTHKLKIIQQEISFASKYNKNNAKNARQQRYKKHTSPEDVLKIIILVQTSFKMVININSKKFKK